MMRARVLRLALRRWPPKASRSRPAPGALQSGHLRAAGLDVFATEPLPADSPLLALDNVVLMPHVAWLTPETLDRSLDVAVDNMRRLRDGAELQFRVV